MTVQRIALLVLVIGIAAATALAGCSRAADTANLTELHRARSGSLDIVLLSPRRAVRQGKDSFVIEFRSADGTLVDVGTVRVNATMPMGGAPMVGSVDVQPADVPGRYRATSDLGMAGGWQMTVDWNGPAGTGSARFQQSVQ